MHETRVEEVGLRGLLVRPSECTHAAGECGWLLSRDVICDTRQKTSLDAPLLMQLELNWIVLATLFRL